MVHIHCKNLDNKTVPTSIWINAVLCCAQPCRTLCAPMDFQQPAGLLYSWDFSGKNTGVGCHFLLQGIFPTQESNPHLLHWQAEPPGKPNIINILEFKIQIKPFYFCEKKPTHCEFLQYLCKKQSNPLSSLLSLNNWPSLIRAVYWLGNSWLFFDVKWVT